MSYVTKELVARILDQFAADAAAERGDRDRSFDIARGTVYFAHFAGLIDSAEYERRHRALRCSQFGEEVVAANEARRREIACGEGPQA